jgi:hypothetical protein
MPAPFISWLPVIASAHECLRPRRHQAWSDRPARLLHRATCGPGEAKLESLARTSWCLRSRPIAELDIGLVDDLLQLRLALDQRQLPQVTSVEIPQIEATEAAWRVCLAKRTEADFRAWRDQQALTERKYAMWKRGERIPTQRPSSLMTCPCGHVFDSQCLDHTVIHVPHITASAVMTVH